MTRCSFDACGREADFLVSHDERGELSVCPLHAKNIVRVAGIGEVVRCV